MALIFLTIIGKDFVIDVGSQNAMNHYNYCQDSGNSALRHPDPDPVCVCVCVLVAVGFCRKFD